MLPLLASQASRSSLPLAAEWLGDSSVELQPCDFSPLTGQALSALPRYDVLPSAHVTPASAVASTRLPSPVAVISLDAKNAFNAISRQAVYDGVSGVASRAYSNGRVPVGCAFGSPNPLFPFMPMIHAYYGSVTQLRHNPSGDAGAVLPGTAGVQQGDVLGPALYCSGQHAVNVRVADANPNVHSVGYLDNNHLCGPILDGLKAAAETVEAMRADLDLEVNLDSSWIFVPEWLGAGISTLPPEYAALFPTLAHLPVVQEGVKILGVPTGTDAFVAEFLSAKAAKITSILPHLAALSDGKVHFQAVKFCVLPKFHFLWRALPPSLTLRTAEVIDDAAISAVCCYGGWDREAVVKKARYLNPHKFILQLPHSKGGLALTPLAGRALPAHYDAT